MRDSIWAAQQDLLATPLTFTVPCLMRFNNDRHHQGWCCQFCCCTVRMYLSIIKRHVPKKYVTPSIQAGLVDRICSPALCCKVSILGSLCSYGLWNCCCINAIGCGWIWPRMCVTVYPCRYCVLLGNERYIVHVLSSLTSFYSFLFPISIYWAKAKSTIGGLIA
jgi:hypothetical protein